MSKEISVMEEHAIDKSTYNALKSSLYPGASDESVAMVVSYCRARKIDPMLKPVHIVPMSVKTGKDKYEWKDVIMPGIGLYRIDASRSGLYAGMSEPEFGDDVTEQVGTKKITYPKWCKITVKKIVNNQIVEFTAKEFWKENYAQAKKDDSSPNAMWAKRPYGQLAKCAEAQALRKAFPDVVGQEVTGEEMEGKTFESEVIKIDNTKISGKSKEDIEIEVLDQIANDINSCTDIETLKQVFVHHMKLNPSFKQQITIIKDTKKKEIEISLEDDFASKITEEQNEK